MTTWESNGHNVTDDIVWPR